MTALSRAALAALLAGAAGIVCIGTSAAMPQIPTGDTDAPVVEASIVGQMPVSATPGSAYVLTVDADVAGASTPALWSVDVTDGAFSSAAELDSFLVDPSASTTHRVATTPAGPSPMGHTTGSSDGDTVLSVPPGGLGLDAAVPGVYGVTVTLTIDGEVAWQIAAPLTWRPAALPSLQVATFASVYGEPLIARGRLAAADDPRVTLIVDPTSLTDDQLASVDGREVFSMPASGVDLSSIAHASTPAVLERALERSRALSDAPVIALAAVADEQTLAMAASFSLRATVLSSAWSAAPQGMVGPVGTASLDGGATERVLLPDAQLSAAIAAAAGDPAGDAMVLAMAAFAATDGRGPLLVEAANLEPSDGGRASTALRALMDAPFLESISVAGLLDAAGPAVEVPDVSSLPSDATPADVVSVAAALQRLDALAGAALEPSQLLQDAERALLSALSCDGRLDATARATAVADAVAVAEEFSGAVSVSSGTDVLLVSSSGDVPVTVKNALDVPVTVTVAMTSRSPILAVKAQPSVTIEPGSEATVVVPVSAVSSGDVGVSVALRTDEGATVAVAETLQVRVRAAWGTAATGIITAGLALLLIAGVVRTIRRGRRDTRLLPGDGTAIAGDESAEAPTKGRS